MSDKEDGSYVPQDQLDRVRKALEERIEKLELAIKNSPPNSHLKEQIAELRELIENNFSEDVEASNINLKAHVSMENMINELRGDCMKLDVMIQKQINELKEEINSLYANETRDLDQMLNIEEVLRELMECLKSDRIPNKPNDWDLLMHDKFRELLEKLDAKEDRQPGGTGTEPEKEIIGLENLLKEIRKELIEESQADLLSIFECPTLECVKVLCNQYIEKWRGRVK